MTIMRDVYTAEMYYHNIVVVSVCVCVDIIY